MNLAELLDATAKDHLDDRTDLVSGDPDSLYSDSYLTRQFNKAQTLLARRAWCIVEYGVSPAGQIVLSTGKTLYTIHKSILRVYDATPTTQTAPLGRSEDVNLRDTSLLSRRPGDNTFEAYELGEAAVLGGGTVTESGAPLAFATDSGTRTLRVFPPPTSDQNGLVVKLKIARYPLVWLSVENMDGVPEVPDEFHDDLITFAAGRALTLPNLDSDQKAEGRRLLDEFAARCRDAKQDRLRAEYGPNRWNFNSTTALLR